MMVLEAAMKAIEMPQSRLGVDYGRISKTSPKA